MRHAGQLNDPLQVAAAALAMPCFMFLTVFANLFGPGSILNRTMHISGIAWATPFADWIAFGISAALFVPCLRRLGKTHTARTAAEGSRSLFAVPNQIANHNRR